MSVFNRHQSSGTLLEQLESRVLLATVTWDGGAGTSSWHDAMNWDTDSLPGASDDVVIDVMGEVETITHSSNVATTVNSITNSENFDLSDGTISTAAGWTQSGDMDMSGGTVTGAGDLVLGSSFDWSGGTMNGSGRTFVSSGQTAQIEGSVTLGRLFSNLGTLLWTSGDISMTGATINNKGTFFTSGELDLNDVSGTNEIANNSLMVRQNTGMVSSQTDINVEFKNNGQLTVGSGSIKFSKNFAAFSGSIALTASSSRLKIFGPTSSIKSGVIVFGSGAIAYQGGVNTVDGNLSSVGEVTVDGGAKLFANAAASIQNLDLDDAVINAANTITIQNRFRQFGGTIKSGGSVTINNGATMVLNNNGPMFQGLDITNNGTTTLQTGVWRPFNMTFTNNGTLNLEAGSIRTASGSNTIANAGTLNKNTAGVVDIFSGQGPTALDNTGTVNVNEGTFKVSGGGSNAGTIDVDSILQIRDNTYFNSGTISGTGLLSMFSNINWTAGEISVADFKVNAGTSLALIGVGAKTLASALNVLGAVNWNDGELTLSSADLTIRNNAFLTFGGSTTPIVTSSSVETLTGGTLRKTTTLVIDFDDTMSLTNGGTVKVEAGSLAFNGDMVSNIAGGVLAGGTWVVQGGGALLTGASGSVTTLNAAVNISGANSTYATLNGLETNQGTIVASDGATVVVGTGSEDGFTNLGTIDLNNGVLQSDGDFTSGANSTTIIRVNASGDVGEIQAVGGTATLSGTLNTIFNGYTPEMTVMHTFITASTLVGNFSTQTFMGTPDGFSASINYTSILAQIVLTEL